MYPSKANYFLVELVDGSKDDDLTLALFVHYGIYIELCKGEVCLKGKIVRATSQKKKMILW